MLQRNEVKVLLAGIGGDSHSVGLILLRQALQLSGYKVNYLGTQNKIEDVVACAEGLDAVLISCMDGHAHHYLRNFTRIERKDNALWYLGGNPSILPADKATQLFVEMGFRRLFLRFVSISTVISFLEEDLSQRTLSGQSAFVPNSFTDAPQVEMCLDSRIADIDHDYQRKTVLLQWRTGAAVHSLMENATFLVSRPHLAGFQKKADEEGCSLVQPRCGVADEHEQFAIFDKLAASNADVLSYQIDSLTRNNNYSEAQRAIAETRRSGQSTLNGFPLINHGVDVLRHISLQVEKPLQCRHSTKDPRLLAEICFAGGVSGFEGGPICYNLPYYKDYPVAQSINSWKYVDRLAGRYFEEFGIVIDREFFGVLTATLIPPSLAISTGLLEAALAVKQGVKSVSIGYAEQGNRIQDVAAIKVIPDIAKKFFSALDFREVQISTVFHQYMSAFPEDKQKAEQLILASSVTAALSRATRILTKTSVEATSIPTVEHNINSLHLTKKGFHIAPTVNLDDALLSSEMKLIEEETNAILDSVLNVSGGDLAQGIVKAVMCGFIDIPFSPSIHNAGRVITARDTTGAIRFLDTGSLPFPREVREFHSECIGERTRYSNIPLQRGYEIVEKDVMGVPTGEVKRWPINEKTISAYCASDQSPVSGMSENSAVIGGAL
ncbi:methylaspartate mutase subunit E (plasmid) [Roseibium aggregatum]|uniref:methylaspartate mutase subunit E n=1 Tax=Roseibium aggregatum TaxID=187304 RepID=UPI001E2F20F4|nr:methylaspartate mutase subunit E [Roseibium aggregatum]UES60169.1 methylaspartate mutase subunit E [Roseibium aggregatum]UES60280.1 methylaspartate mutase subunit E [Roseibium aggregatum]